MNFTDQMGNNISLEKTPVRIISTVPSQTELLYDLGLRDEVIGITAFCIHPEEWFRTKIRIGGTKKLNIEKIKSLKPDLIIGNKEENEEEQIKELMKDFPVWTSDIKNLEDAFQMMTNVGELIKRKQNAQKIIDEIKTAFELISPPEKKISTLYLIWKNPYMCAGQNTFVNEMLKRCGFENATVELRYPEITTEEVRKINPGLILLSSEPYPFKQKHIEELKAIIPSSEIMLVDGEMFSWYGSHLKKSPNYFSQLLKRIHS